MLAGPEETLPPVADSLRKLLAGVIDYAGLFPPAALELPEALRKFEEYRFGPHGWMMNRFVVPQKRRHEVPEKLSVSVLTDDPGTVDDDMIEVKATTVDEIAALRDEIPMYVHAYVEIPIAGDPSPLLDALVEYKMHAKIRTGGLTPDTFPRAEDIAHFIALCSERGLPFKATAGLHHPLRCVKPLTYAADAPTGAMHGFLNVLLAAAFIDHGLDPETATELLLESDPSAFAFGDAAAMWRDYEIDTLSIGTTRTILAHSFGSCSFEEPVADLKELGWL